jgi:catechol 2,3-dioxygenase-like lactoylglutathione lyase family enzyme
VEQRLSAITIGVSDLARSRKFYEDGLGWKIGLAPDGVAFYQMNGFVVSLFPLPDLQADARVSTPLGIGGIALAHNVQSREQVDATLAQAERAGATILKPGIEAEWGGYSGYFADPDGHGWEVAWNPGWPIHDDGTTTLK